MLKNNRSLNDGDKVYVQCLLKTKEFEQLKSSTDKAP